LWVVLSFIRKNLSDFLQAGLFSAVSSAFIIQIQPQLTPPLTVNTVTVLSLLYISLFTTLLAALLAVLGKQRIMYYQAAGSRGSIEERGLERQYKLDGLRKWKFDAVLQMFPMLLQLALLLFSLAISVYLWTIHRSIATIVIALTVFSFASYIFLLVSTIVSPDSPFQTPLGSFLIQLVSQSWKIFKPMFDNVYESAEDVGSSLYRFIRTSTYILPSFMSQASSNPNLALWELNPNWYFSETSSEASAVVWILETSTDPRVVTAAAELAVDLQWPLDRDLTSARMCLHEIFYSCFDFGFMGTRFVAKLRRNMADRAIKCGRALCSLNNVAQASGHHLDLGWHHTLSEHTEDIDLYHWTQLSIVIQFLKGQPGMIEISDSMSSDKWGLHTFASLDPEYRVTLGQKGLEYFLDTLHVDQMPSLDELTFTNYLCCIMSFLAPVNPRMSVEVDKRSVIWFI
jgi:hypothetical protein